jgi:hypothetical protein
MLQCSISGLRIRIVRKSSELKWDRGNYSTKASRPIDIVVLGGVGTFGSVLVEKLARDTTLRVTAVDKRASTTNDSSRLRFVRLDLNENDLSALASLQPHIVVNAMGSWNDYRLPEYCVKNRMFLLHSCLLFSLFRLALH